MKLHMAITESVREYYRAENLITALRSTGERMSDGLMVAMALKMVAMVLNELPDPSRTMLSV